MPEHVGAVPGLVCPAIVAHRGASARHPENTLVAFEAAIMAGADMIELDVRLTADGVPVVLHDQDVAVTTDGSGLVNEMTLAQVKFLHAGTARQRRESVPTLREALTLLRGRAAVEIDIKNDPGEPGFDGSRQPLADQVLELLDALRFGSAIVTSENPQTVEWVKRHAPLIATGIEIEESADLEELLAYSAARGYAFVLPSADAVLDAGRQFVDHAHALGLQLDVWTVDDPRLMTELLAWGVDVIETNDPDMAVPIRDRVRRTRDLPAGGC
jgi:glycerophosphoryl diester phosphodiesterase